MRQLMTPPDINQSPSATAAKADRPVSVTLPVGKKNTHTEGTARPSISYGEVNLFTNKQAGPFPNMP